MHSKRTWRLSSIIAVAVLVLLCGSSATWAVNLGGTTWNLTGWRKVSVTGYGTERKTLDTGQGVLTFNGAPADLSGTCRLDTYDNGVMDHSYPCTWSTVAGKQPFVVTLDPVPTEAELESEASGKLGGAVDITITKNFGKGRVGKRNGVISFTVTTKGTLTVGSDPRLRKFSVVIHGTGLPI
jgi:hypothetical protein